MTIVNYDGDKRSWMSNQPNFIIFVAIVCVNTMDIMVVKKYSAFYRMVLPNWK